MAICKTNVGLLAAIVILTVISEVSQVSGGYSYGEKKRDRALERCEEDLSYCRSKSVNCKRLEYELLTMTTCKTRLEREVEELKCALRNCKKHSKKFEDQVICMTNTINDLRSQLMRKEKQLEECNNKIGAIEDKYETIIKIINGNYDDCKKQVINILGELDDAGDNLQECIDNKTIIQGELDDCKNETSGLRNQILIAQIDLRNKNKDLEDCDDARNALILANANCEARAEGLGDALAKCSSNLTTANEALVECNARADAEAAAFANCSGLYDDCTEKVKKLNKEIDDIFNACNKKFESLDQSKFIFVGKKTYYVVQSQSLDWSEAEAWCWANGMNGLACPKSANEFNSIFLTLNATAPDDPADQSSWHIGYTRFNQPSSTWWCDKIGSVPNTDIPWSSGEPNDRDGDETILTVIHNDGVPWGINDRPANNSLNFICEVDQDCVDILFAPA